MNPSDLARAAELHEKGERIRELQTALHDLCEAVEDGIQPSARATEARDVLGNAGVITVEVRNTGALVEELKSKASPADSVGMKQAMNADELNIFRMIESIVETTQVVAKDPGDYYANKARAVRGWSAALKELEGATGVPDRILRAVRERVESAQYVGD